MKSPTMIAANALSLDDVVEFLTGLDLAPTDSPPRWVARDKGGTAARGHRSPITNRSLHILVVEDEPAVRTVVVEFLRSESHTVEIAAEGLEALRKFQEGAFDLVLSDRSLPNLNGDDLTTRIKEIQPDMPVILVSAMSALGETAETPSSADCTLGKPFSFCELRRAMAKVTKSASTCCRLD